MALKTSILLLLVVVVSCNCKPLRLCGPSTFKEKLESNANANAEPFISLRDRKIGGRGSAHVVSGVDATGNFRSYVYTGGLGVRNDAGYDTGAKLAGDASGNGAIRKGDSLLSSNEIDDLNRLNRVNMLDNQVYSEKSATTKSYFK